MTDASKAAERKAVFKASDGFHYGQHMVRLLDCLIGCEDWGIFWTYPGKEFQWEQYTDNIHREDLLAIPTLDKAMKCIRGKG